LLTANVPFNGDSDYQIMTDHVNAPPPLPTKFYPYIPQGLQNGVLKALEKNPDARFQTVEEFGAALEQPDTFGVVPVQIVPGVIPAPRGATVVESAPRGATMVETAAPPVAAVVAAGVSGVPAKASFWTPERKIAGGSAAIIFALVAGWAALRPNVKNTGLPTAPGTVTSSQSPAQPEDNGIPALPPVPQEPARPSAGAPHAGSTPAAGGNSALAIPAGTPVIVRLIDNVDSSRDRTGQRFAASVDAPVVVGGRTVIARGAGARVVLINVTQAGPIEGRSEIKLELVSLAINGTNYVVRSNLFDQQGVARGKPSAKVIAGGAAVGAAIGGIFGKGKGAAAGAAAGAGGGAAVAAKVPPVIVPAETRIKFTLRTPIS